MAGGDYGQRVSATSSDEVGELARTFNAMAADLAGADLERRRLVATVSHELRTPAHRAAGPAGEPRRRGRDAGQRDPRGGADPGRAAQHARRRPARPLPRRRRGRPARPRPGAGRRPAGPGGRGGGGRRPAGRIRQHTEPADLTVRRRPRPPRTARGQPRRQRGAAQPAGRGGPPRRPRRRGRPVGARGRRRRARHLGRGRGAGLRALRHGCGRRGGTGLGLAIVRWVCELHGGRVEVLPTGAGAPARTLPGAPRPTVPPTCAGCPPARSRRPRAAPSPTPTREVPVPTTDSTTDAAPAPPRRRHHRPHRRPARTAAAGRARPGPRWSAPGPSPTAGPARASWRRRSPSARWPPSPGRPATSASPPRSSCSRPGPSCGGWPGTAATRGPSRAGCSRCSSRSPPPSGLRWPGDALRARRGRRGRRGAHPGPRAARDRRELGRLAPVRAARAAPARAHASRRRAGSGCSGRWSAPSPSPSSSSRVRGPLRHGRRGLRLVGLGARARPRLGHHRAAHLRARPRVGRRPHRAYLALNPPLVDAVTLPEVGAPVRSGSGRCRSASSASSSPGSSGPRRPPCGAATPSCAGRPA